MAWRHQRWVWRVGAPAASEQEQQEEARRLGQAAASPEVTGREMAQASRRPKVVAPKVVAPRVSRAAARASEQPGPTAQPRRRPGWHGAAARPWRRGARGARGAARWRRRRRPPGRRAVRNIGHSMSRAAPEAAAAAMGMERRACVWASVRACVCAGGWVGAVVPGGEAGRGQGGGGAEAGRPASLRSVRAGRRDGSGARGSSAAATRSAGWARRHGCPPRPAAA